MILTGQDSVAYVSVAVQVVNAAGEPAAADANPVSSFYRVDGTSGALALDILVGTGGSITMAPMVGVTGLYYAAVPVASLGHVEYKVRTTWQVAGANRAQLDELRILTEIDVLSRDAVTPAISTRLTKRST